MTPNTFVKIIHSQSVNLTIKMYNNGVVFLVIVGIVCGLSIGHCNCDSIELYDRLNLLINYVTEHEESQRPDLMLGVYICKGDEKRKNFFCYKFVKVTKLILFSFIESSIGCHSVDGDCN